MDRYEYNVRLEQIRSLAENQEFHEAMVIADTIDWRKVRSARTLSFISEIYKINRRYEEAKDILLIADSRCPNARSIIYALCELSMKMEDLNDSVGYLKEYMEMAPQDPETCILQYKFYVLTKVGIQQRIEILEQLKGLNYRERWGYELARLYSEAGEISKCIDECDNLILWFGHGKYVTEAMKLKMLYTDLTPEQQHKYDHRDGLELLAGAVDLSSDDDIPEKKEPLSIEITNIQPSNQPTKRIPGKEINEHLGVEDIKEPSVNLDKYSTMNLQAELKKNMVDLEVKTGEPLREKEVPLPPLENVTPMKADTELSEIMPDAPAPAAASQVQAPKAPAPQAPMSNYEDEDIFSNRKPLNLKKDPGESDVESQFARILSEEYDGQMSLNVPDDPETAEKQITGQINIEDILSGWNKQKEQHEKHRMAEAKRRSLEQTNDIVNELVGVIPGVHKTDLPDIPSEDVAPEVEMPVAKPVEIEREEIETPEPRKKEKAKEEKAEAPDEASETAVKEAPVSRGGMKRETLEITSDLTGLLREHREKVNARLKKKQAKEEEPEETEEIEEPEEIAEEPDDIEEDERYEDAPEPEDEGDDYLADEEEDEEEEEEKVKPRKAKGKKKNKYTAPKAQEVQGFDEEEKEIFAQFLPMHDLPGIIRDALDRMQMKGSCGNVFITGNEQSARINLANALSQGFMYEHPEEFVGKIAHISADIFNTKNVQEALKTLDGCALLIEHAADLSDSSLEDIRTVLTSPDVSLILILEETKASFRMFERRNKKEWMDQIFDVRIEIPTYTNDDLVFHGREYAREREYIIDDMGVLALYTKIDELQTADHFVTIDEVEEIVDKAIRHVNRKTPGHFLDVVVGKRYDDDDLIILREKDFI